MNKLLKLTVILIFICISTGKLFSQEIDTIYISGTYNEIPVEQILFDYEKLYGLKFCYKSEWLSAVNFTGIFNHEKLDFVIARLISPKGLTYYPCQQNIILLPREEIGVVLGDLIELGKTEKNGTNSVIVGDINLTGKYKKVKVCGTILNGANGEPLAGATLIVENTTIYTVTNGNGYYELELSPAVYTLSASYFGFENSKVALQVISPGILDIEIFEKTQEIKEVIVTALRADQNVRSSQMSIVQLDAKSIKQLPSLVGEKDIIKSLTMMPGVKSVGEFGSGINVRGGGEDQNLYLIENTPIFNTSHVMGLLSVVNPDAVHAVSLYKGHIPAEYGERVSSVLDIGLKDYNCQEFHVRGGIGIYNSRLLFEGLVFKKKINYKIGARSSYSDYLLKQMPDYNLMNSSAKFYDITGLVNIALRNNPITLFGYYSYDYFKYAQNFTYNYGNKLGSVDWFHIFSNSLSTSLSFSYSNYSITREDFMNYLDYHSVWSQINYLSGKFSTTFSGIKNHAIKAGFQAIHYTIAPGNKSPIDGSESKSFITQNENSNELSAFINDVFEINPAITLQYGLRYTNYAYLGPKTIYSYASNQQSIVEDSTVYGQGEKIISYSGLEPRISAKFQIEKNSSIKLSYNKNRQYINLLSYTSISTPEDIWKLADPYIKPIEVNQFALGYYRNFFRNTIETSVEIYYKDMRNLLEYKNGAQLSLNNHVETELINAHGQNYGVEFLLRKSGGKLDGWITYTYSRATKQTNESYYKNQINKNNTYPSQFDKPHDLTVFGNYHYNRRLRFGANFALASGRSITLPEMVFKQGNYDIVYYSDRNKYRLPLYHRLDLSMSIDESLKKNKRWKGSWTFSVLNVYARKNAYSVFYKQETPSEFNNYELFSMYKLYLIGKPLPTITYNFIF